MKRFLGILAFEYRMSIRRWGFWLGFGVAFLPYVLSMLAPQQPEEAFSQAMLRAYAGETAYHLNLYLPVVAGIVIADRLVRDRRLGVDELLKSSPLNRVTYILGKYFGAMLSILTPAFLILAAIAAYVSIYGKTLEPVPWFLLAFVSIVVPAYAFITIFSLACPMIMPLRVYQVLFTGYWVWGNFLSPNVFPTLAGTLLTPGGEFAMEGFFGAVVSSGQTVLHTPLEAVLNLAVLGACVLAAMFVLERYLALRAKAA